MKVLFILSSFFFFISVGLFGQTMNVNTDINSPYSINPNPHLITNTDVADPIEEIFGTNENQFGPSGERGRGNIFYCTTPKKLKEHRLYLNPTASADMWFCVYEGNTQQGLYLLVNSVSVQNVGPGEGWYGSGTIDVDLEFGKYYMIITQWDVPTSYWNEQNIDPYPIQASFGVLQSGVGWNWVPVYTVPPEDSQMVMEGFVDPIAYYQAIVTDDLVSVPGANSEIVSDYQLYNNFPNPFNPATTISYAIPEQSYVELSVLNTLGEQIAILVSDDKEAGNHSVSFDAANLPSGIYFYSIKAGDFTSTKKMILMK